MAKTTDGKWITVNGTHIFIKNGQSAEDAFKETTGKTLTGKSTTLTDEERTKKIIEGWNQIKDKGFVITIPRAIDGDVFDKIKNAEGQSELTKRMDKLGYKPQGQFSNEVLSVYKGKDENGMTAILAVQFGKNNKPKQYTKFNLDDWKTESDYAVYTDGHKDYKLKVPKGM